MFFSMKKKITNICISICNESIHTYYNLLKDYLEKSPEISSEEYELEILMPFRNSLYNKATNIVNESKLSNVITRWRLVPLANICGFDIDFEHLSLGMIYAMLYYSFSGKIANSADCIYLNHYSNSLMQKVLEELDDKQ